MYSRLPVDSRRQAFALALAALPLVVLALWNPRLPDSFGGLAVTQWHTLVEFASMLACAAITAVAWNSRDLEVPSSVHVLGSACAGALLLDLAHTLSFPGMPEFITPNTWGKASTLFVLGRGLVALALLCVAALPWQLEYEARWMRRAPWWVAAYVLFAFLAVISIINFRVSRDRSN